MSRGNYKNMIFTSSLSIKTEVWDMKTGLRWIDGQDECWRYGAASLVGCCCESEKQLKCYSVDISSC